MSLEVKIKLTNGVEPDFPLPSYESSGAAGLDIRAYLPQVERVNGHEILPGKRSLISSGFEIEIPSGFEGQIRARSGLSLKFGIALANGVGTIDSDYRGTVGVLLINLGNAPFTVNHGDRIAQLVFSSVVTAELMVAKSISKTDRGEKGFGSTG